MGRRLARTLSLPHTAVLTEDFIPIDGDIRIWKLWNEPSDGLSTTNDGDLLARLNVVEKLGESISEISYRGGSHCDTILKPNCCLSR